MCIGVGQGIALVIERVSAQSGQEEGPQDILVSRHGAHVLHLVLNRPAVRNALRNQSLQEIVQVLAQAEADDSVRAVVISGNEKAFAAGADLNEMIQKEAIATQLDVRAQYWRAIARFPNRCWRP
jgi:enoyl-CoA hydratase